MLHIVVATRNAHKVRELAQLLRMRDVRWHSLQEFPEVPSLKETGRTFDANAIQKARAAAQATGYLALADDSGIEVDALGGAPGIRSARFAGHRRDDAANNRKLLRLLRALPLARRGARYRCSLALASPTRLLALVHGAWRGRIAFAPAGQRGFGYDPVFLATPMGRTVGQLSAAFKRRYSHRAQAARRMQRVVERLALIQRGVCAAPRRRSARGRPASGRLA